MLYSEKTLYEFTYKIFRFTSKYIYVLYVNNVHWSTEIYTNVQKCTLMYKNIH